jgi:hypothetical protein
MRKVASDSIVLLRTSNEGDILLYIYFFLVSADKSNVSARGVLRLGRSEIKDSDKLLEEAVDLAKDWETEGTDRTNLALPGRTDELIARIAAVDAKTVAVTHAVHCLIITTDIFSEDLMIPDRALR